MENSLCEKPERHAPRRLSDYLMLEGQMQKVHSLVDKVYKRKNLKLAWERVRANRGASGTDGITIDAFEADLDANLERLHQELRDRIYQPQPVRRLEIPGGPPARRGHWAYHRFATGCVNRHWSIAWSRSLRTSLIRAALGIVKVARQPMP